MKFWQKTYLCVLCVFLITLDFAAFALLQKSYSLNEQTETDRASAQFESAGKSLDYMLANFERTAPKSELCTFIKSFAEAYLDDKMLLEVYDSQGQQLFSNSFELVGERTELKGGTIKSAYRKVNGRLYLFTGGILAQSGLKMAIAYDVNYLDEYFRSLLRYFILLSVLLSLILSLALGLLVRRITAPLRSLNIAAKEIAGGAYDKRVKITSGDEIGEFAENFNQMTEAVSENIARLEEAAKAKEVFINNLTHELKTPITALKGYTTFLRDASASAEDRRMAEEYILEHTNRLNILSGKLMDLLYLKNETFHPAPVNVSQLFSYVKKMELFSLDSKSVCLNIHCTDPALTVNGDEALLHTLFINLVENSIRASEPGAVISLSGHEEEKGIVLEVEDRGCGIPQKELDKITDAFYTVDSSRTKAAGGIGLGLSICKLIVQLHGACMEIDAKPNRGTKVILTFCQ